MDKEVEFADIPHGAMQQHHHARVERVGWCDSVRLPDHPDLRNRVLTPQMYDAKKLRG
jgi:hypothetical protein